MKGFLVWNPSPPTPLSHLWKFQFTVASYFASIFFLAYFLFKQYFVLRIDSKRHNSWLQGHNVSTSRHSKIWQICTVVLFMMQFVYNEMSNRSLWMLTYDELVVILNMIDINRFIYQNMSTILGMLHMSLILKKSSFLIWKYLSAIWEKATISLGFHQHTCSCLLN